MENAVDALKMAAAVLTFVMALGISISTLSQAKQTAQTLLNYTDREYEAQYVEDTGEKERTVGSETIIPTLYRAYKENYKILFYDKNNNPLTLYSKEENGINVNVNYIDLEKDVLGDDRQKDNFIMALLYGSNANNLINSQGGRDMSFNEFKQELIANNSKINLKDEGIYDKILKGNTFTEKFGVYYQEDISTGDSNVDIDGTNQNSSTPNTNKTKKRIISYYQN